MYTIDSKPSDYHVWVTYWVILHILLYIEFNFFHNLSMNLGYYFIRTLFLFYLAERKFFNSEFGPFKNSANIVLNKIGKMTDIKALCALIENEEDIVNHVNLHPWAPTPSTTGILAICRIGEIFSLEIAPRAEDEEYLIKNGLDKIVEYLDNSEDAKSQNCLLCLLFLSERKIIKNRLVCMNLIPKLKRFVDAKFKLLVETALRLCKNIYSLNYDLQGEFINAGLSKRLVDCLKEHDPFSVIEAFDNITSLICVSFN